MKKMKNGAARVITGRPYEIETNEIFNELNWQPLADRWEKNKLVFMYKVKNS
jgi:hypothetical protein